VEGKHVEHQKHTLLGVPLVFDSKGNEKTRKNAHTDVSTCLIEGKHVEHQKHTLLGVPLVFDREGNE
jgi:hypothetical protein